METFLEEDYFDQLHHNPDKHGLIWKMLEKVLHFFVTIFILFGIIKFKIHFVDRNKLYRQISHVFITFHCYIFLKFTLIAFITYLFNLQVNSENSILYKFNCSSVGLFAPYARFDHQQSFEGMLSNQCQ